jgi:hypothetical protein
MSLAAAALGTSAQLLKGSTGQKQDEVFAPEQSSCLQSVSSALH